MPEDEKEECNHDFDWMAPPDSDDPMDEVLACLNCGQIKWTARDLARDDRGTTA